MVKLLIDSCAWNFFYEKCDNLSTLFSPTDYSIFMPKELRIEMDAIPLKKKNLKEWIERQLMDYQVENSCHFGFSSVSDPVERKSPLGGFGEGFFVSAEFNAEIKKYSIGNKLRGSGLYTNEADALLCAYSKMDGFLVVTNDSQRNFKKIDSTKDNIIFLNDYDECRAGSLKYFLRQNIKN